MRRILIIIIVLFSITLSAQSNLANTLRKHDYSSVDQKVKNYNPASNASIAEVAKQLSKFGYTEAEKVRAIYMYLALHIEYDNSYSNYHYPETFKDKAGVCQGFSELFVEMCTHINIKSKLIIGIGKGESYSIEENYFDNDESMKISNHAWNAVFIYDNWFLIDATWASCTKPAGIERYWLSKPNEFIYSHLPLDGKYNHESDQWEYTVNTQNQLLGNSPITYQEFVKIDKRTLKEYVFYDSDDIATEDVDLMRFYAENEVEHTVSDEVLPLYLKLKEYTSSGQLETDFNALRNYIEPYTNPESIDQLINTGEEKIIQMVNKLKQY